MDTADPGSTHRIYTVGRLVTSAAEYLKSRDLEDPRLSAEILLAHALTGSRLQLYTRWSDPVADEVRDRFREAVRRAASGEPVAYIVGHKEFFSMDFEVTPAVLIPRPETELLVDRVLAYVKNHPRPTWQILEPGTGSGNIGAAIIKNTANAYLVATDIQPEAIAVARRNFTRHGLADRVKVAVADWMKIPVDLVPEGGFDLIVANPPYVGTGRTACVDERVLKSEPPTALFGGADGLDFYRRTVDEAPPVLKADGALFCEVGCGDADKVVAIFAAVGWRNAGRWKDLAGIERTLQFAPPAAAPEPSPDRAPTH
jgi:release factor glutamine methyltransferase